MIYSNAPRTAIRFTKIKPTYSWPDAFDLHVLANQLIPFQIIRPSRGNAITSFRMVSLDDVTDEPLLLALAVANLPYILSFPQIDRIIYKAKQESYDVFYSGRWYLEITDGVDTWYSMDVINVPCIAMIPPSPNPVNDDPETIMINDNNQLEL